LDLRSYRATRFSSYPDSSLGYLPKVAHVPRRGPRLQTQPQLDLPFQAPPPVILTEDERAQLISAIAAMLLSAIQVNANE
jgi:hypothetical protein